MPLLAGLCTYSEELFKMKQQTEIIQTTSFVFKVCLCLVFFCVIPNKRKW